MTWELGTATLGSRSENGRTGVLHLLKSSRLGLIRWYDQADRHFQHVEAFRDKMCNTRDAQLMHCASTVQTL